MRAMTRKVFKDIGHRKIRTALTILGIAIGVIGLMAISIASSQFRSSLAYSSNVRSQPDIQIYTSPTTPALAQTLMQQQNVTEVQAQGSIVTQWAIGSNQQLIHINGIVDFQHMTIDKFKVVAGILPGPGQILLELGDRSLTAVQIGDRISIQTGKTYKDLTVSGFAVTQGRALASIAGEAYGYMDEKDFEPFFHRSGVTNFAVRIKNYAIRYQTLDELSNVLQAHSAPVVGTDVGRDDTVSQIANGIFGVMDVLSVVAILLSVILLLSTVMSLVTEQMQTIGTMKAIGAQRGQIMRHYLALIALYSTIGTAIGIVVGIVGGYALANYLASLVSLDIGALQVAPWQIAEGIAIGIGTPVVAALLPVYFGTRITVRQALSGYGVSNTAAQESGLWAEVSRRIFGKLPQTIQFGMRGVFRRRVRTVLTLIVLAVAGSSFLAVQTASYSFNTFLNQIYNVYHYDAMVNLSDSITLNQFQQALKPVADIKRIESMSQDTVATKWGNAALVGLQINTQLYHKQMVAGHWFTGSDSNAVIISEDAASKAGLKVGDTISFDLDQYHANWHIIGIARDYSGIGPGNLGVLLAPITQIDTLVHAPTNAASMVMIQSTNPAPTQSYLDDLANRIGNALSNAGYLPDVMTPQDQIAQAQSKYQIIYTMFDAVAIIIALVGAVALANTLAMSVLERRKEIGILRSMGAVGRKVAQVFWAEGTTLGLLSWVLALALGIPATFGFLFIQARLLAPVPFAFNPLSLVWMFIVIIALSALASIGPASGAMRMRIAQTLRYE